MKTNSLYDIHLKINELDQIGVDHILEHFFVFFNHIRATIFFRYVYMLMG